MYCWQYAANLINFFFFYYVTANMFRKFYPEASELLVERFVQASKSLNKNLSPASVQGHFMFYKSDPEDAIVNLHKLR